MPKTDTAICALLWAPPHYGRKIGTAHVTGIDTDGHRRSESVPVYERGGLTVNNYRSAAITVYYDHTGV